MNNKASSHVTNQTDAQSLFYVVNCLEAHYPIGLAEQLTKEENLKLERLVNIFTMWTNAKMCFEQWDSSLKVHNQKLATNFFMNYIMHFQALENIQDIGMHQKVF